MKNNSIEAGKHHQETLYATISEEELLLFFHALNASDRIDSRILFQFMQSRIVVCDIEHQHKDWISFAYEAADLGLLPFCHLDVRSSSAGDKFLMVTPEQATFLVLYATHPEAPFLLSLKRIFHAFCRRIKGDSILMAG